MAAPDAQAVNPAVLAEHTRLAEQGDPADAARALLKGCVDDDVLAVEAIMRFAARITDADVERFHSEGEQAYCIQVPGLGDVWLSPLSAWAELPTRAHIVSPRGLKALGDALVEEMAA